MESITDIKFAMDTFFLVISGALVMWMAAGFAMLEAGLVRSKNTTEILAKNIVLFAIACTVYLIVGYNIMYVNNGDASFLPSMGFTLGEEASDATHSLGSDFFFQVVFVATSMSVVSGAVAERMKLTSFLVFSVIMCAFIYPVEGFWTWGGGFLAQQGFSDYAGSGIVHLAGAAAALAGVLIVGPRLGKFGKNGSINPFPGSNLPLSALGTLILWLGWFGFNGGSQLAIASMDDARAVGWVYVNTNAAACAGGISALLLCYILWKKADLTMILNGILAGLVAITADPASPTPLCSVVIGAIAGVLVVLSILFFDKIKVDDPVGALSVHGVCGLFGLLAVPFSNADASYSTQIVGAVCIFAWVFITSLIVWKIIKMVMGVRVHKDEEVVGMDYHDCGLEAYPEFVKNQ